MASSWVAVLVALFVWWFATGAILMVVKRSDPGGRPSHLWAVILSLPVLFLGSALFIDTLARVQVGAIYASFFAALAIWGWVEMTFLTGILTGPDRGAAQPRGGRFARAWRAMAYHELLLVWFLITMGVLAWDAPNPVGFWTFALLYGARISAKLNLFFGVPRINTEFLPEALAHLPAHFGPRRTSWFFPVSVTLLTATFAWILHGFAMNQSEPLAVGLSLVATLAGLALLEHWLMVIPLPDAKLWRWMLPAAQTNDQ